jgi:hypothetical protein
MQRRPGNPVPHLPWWFLVIYWAVVLGLTGSLAWWLIREYPGTCTPNVLPIIFPG